MWFCAISDLRDHNLFKVKLKMNHIAICVDIVGPWQKCRTSRQPVVSLQRWLISMQGKRFRRDLSWWSRQ